ncbi:MAG: DUF2846 domain-containing protein [Nitrospiria bacterium]
MTKKTQILLLLVLVSGMTKCAPDLFSSLENREGNQIKPDPNQSIILVYRNLNEGAGIPVVLFLDGKKLGEIPIKTYFRLEVAPGRHVIRSESDDVSILEVFAEKGKIYFIRQKVTMGFTRSNVELDFVNEKRGNIEIRECKLITLP